MRTIENPPEGSNDRTQSEGDDNSSAGVDVLMKQTPKDDEHAVSPFRKKVAVSSMSRREAFATLKVDVSC